jgi:hypothetical protein
LHRGLPSVLDWNRVQWSSVALGASFPSVALGEKPWKQQKRSDKTHWAWPETVEG